MIIREGMSSRLVLLAKARSAGYTQVGWLNDNECPLTPEQLFKHGIPGMEIILLDQPPWPRLKSGTARPPIAESWAHIWAALELPEMPAVPHGVQFRGHHKLSTPWEAFRHMLEDYAAATTGQVAVLADSHRQDIAAILGDRMLWPTGREMRYDLDRDADQALAHLMDWARFLNAESVITSCKSSSSMWPRRFNPNQTP